MARTRIPLSFRLRLMLARVVPLIFLIVLGGAAYWLYDATSYGYSLKPDFMLESSDLQLREMIRRFERIKNRYEEHGDKEAAFKAAWNFQQDFASRSQNLSTSGARRRTEKLLSEFHRFQERVQ